MVQIWVNLPKKHKMTDPKYQSIKKSNIPTFTFSSSSNIRVIAGRYNNIVGPAKTFTEVNIYEISSKNKDEIVIKTNDNTNTLLLIMRGDIFIKNKLYKEKSIVIFDNKNLDLAFLAHKGFRGLIFNGKPLNEPLVSYGPFVMNTKEEISQAIKDYQNGTMGRIT